MRNKFTFSRKQIETRPFNPIIYVSFSETNNGWLIYKCILWVGCSLYYFWIQSIETWLNGKFIVLFLSFDWTEIENVWKRTKIDSSLFLSVGKFHEISLSNERDNFLGFIIDPLQKNKNPINKNSRKPNILQNIIITHKRRRKMHKQTLHNIQIINLALSINTFNFKLKMNIKRHYVKEFFFFGFMYDRIWKRIVKLVNRKKWKKKKSRKHNRSKLILILNCIQAQGFVFMEWLVNFLNSDRLWI
jgi:hypothetical protein